MKIKWIFAILLFLELISFVALGCAYYRTWVPDPGVSTAMIALGIIMLLTGVTYRKLVIPMRGIANGMDLIRAQDFSSRLAKVGQPEADRIVEMFNAMMLRLRNERLRIREQDHFMDLLISVSPMGIIILDSYGKIMMNNPAAEEFLGMKEREGIIGKGLEELTSPLADGLVRLMPAKTETLRLSDSKIYRCSRLSFMDNGYAHPFILIEHLTQEVMKAEKHAYERVIRIISHEVNNSVAGISSMLSTAGTVAREGDGLSKEDAEMIAEVAEVSRERCMSMSKFISAYADVVKIPPAICRRVNLNEELMNFHSFLESICRPHGVDLVYDLDEMEIEVMMDSMLFQQALINIVKNSVESIICSDNDTNGCVRITTAGGEFRNLTITDNGNGISSDSQSHLFTPFYSSKPSGQGLGLIFIADVLEKHGCNFNLSTSIEDRLTRFSIAFPGIDQRSKDQV